MAKKSKKSKSQKADDDLTWDDATVDKHLKPTLAKKNIWWPDDARKKDLVALLKSHSVSIKEVMEGKKPRKYRRPPKPESEDESSEEEDEEEDEDEEDEASDDSGQVSDDKKKRKTDKQRQHKERQRATAGRDKPAGVDDKMLDSRVELEQYENDIWEDPEMTELLPHLADAGVDFTTAVKEYSQVVKALSPHSVTDFWFYADLVREKYKGDRSALEAALSRFPYGHQIWKRVRDQQKRDPVAWDRLRRLKCLENRKAILSGKGKPNKKATKTSKKAALQSVESSDSDEKSDEQNSDEDGAGSGEDSDDPFDDTQSSSDSDTDSERGKYDSKKARVARGFDDKNAANKIKVEDPERPGHFVKADIIGRHPSRKGWLILALPSNNKKYPQLSRGLCVDGTSAKYNEAFERYVSDGSNKTPSTATEANLHDCAPSEFELNLISTIPWGRNVHTHGYGIFHKKKGEFLMFSKQVLGKKWGSRDADDVLRDHMIKAGQSMPGREGKEIRAKSWRK